MNLILNRAAVLAAMAIGMAAIPAHATLAIKVIDNAGVHSMSDPGDSLTFSVSDSIFQTILAIGTTSSPGGPAEITLDATVKTKASPNPHLPQDIKIIVSSDGFLSPTGMSYLEQSVTTNKPAHNAATGGATFVGYYHSGSALFDTTGPATTIASLPSYNLLTGDTTSSVFSFGSPYTLTEVITMHFATGGQGQVTANLDAIQMVPEPAAVGLLGGILLLTAGSFRRRFRRS